MTEKQKAYARAYYQKNKDKFREIQRRYMAKHPGIQRRYKANRVKWVAEHKEYVQEHSRLLRQLNRAMQNNLISQAADIKLKKTYLSDLHKRGRI